MSHALLSLFWPQAILSLALSAYLLLAGFIRNLMSIRKLLKIVEEFYFACFACFDASIGNSIIERLFG